LTNIEVIAPADVRFFMKRIIAWGRFNYESLPWRSKGKPIHRLIAEILLQRTRAEQVIPTYENLIACYKDIRDLRLLPEEQIQWIIAPLGLHWRAPLLHRMIGMVVDDYRGEVPDDFNELISLPGVGPYAASAYLSLHRGIRVPIIDSNAVRVYGRFFGFAFDSETRRQVWLLELADRLTPRKTFREYNYALLDFGRTVCRRTPLCTKCPLTGRCALASELSRHVAARSTSV